MRRLTWAPQAIEDLEAIRAYVARDFAEYGNLGPYRIVYRLKRDVVDILTVFHGARAFGID